MIPAAEPRDLTEAGPASAGPASLFFGGPDRPAPTLEKRHSGREGRRSRNRFWGPGDASTRLTPRGSRAAHRLGNARGSAIGRAILFPTCRHDLRLPAEEVAKNPAGPLVLVCHGRLPCHRRRRCSTKNDSTEFSFTSSRKAPRPELFSLTSRRTHRRHGIASQAR